MKTASSNLTSLLGTSRDLVFCDLWTITLKNGTVVNWTDWDQDITLSGTTYLSHDVIITGGKHKQSRGLQPNETDLTLYPSLGANGEPESLINGIPFLQACRSGLFDRATVQRQRTFCAGPVSPANPPTFSTNGAVRIFLGEITELDDLTRNMACFKCKDATNLLNIYMPRRQYQMTCPWTFGDSNCRFNKSSLSVASSCLPGSVGTTIICGLANQSGYFNFGDLLFTTGLNAGVRRAVKSFAANGIITVTGPFPQTINVGDVFTITPGCSKNYGAAIQQFNASISYGITPLSIPNTLSNAAGAFNGYTLTFTSGALNGQAQTISQWLPGLATLSFPFTTQPTIGDNFSISNGVTTNNGSVINLLSPTTIPVNLTNATGFFVGGTLQFTSGALVGQTSTITNWANGVATVSPNFPSGGLPGDECTLTSINTSSQSTQSTCTGYNNTANFGGAPFVPIPETAY